GLARRPVDASRPHGPAVRPCPRRCAARPHRRRPRALAVPVALPLHPRPRPGGLGGAGAPRDARSDKLPGLVTGITAPPLPGMTEVEETAADLWATGLTPGRRPSEFVRERLPERGVVTVEALRDLPHRTVVEVAGI